MPTATKSKSKKPQKKTCARCLKVKFLDSFGDNPRMALGKKSYCRPCSAELQREWNHDQRLVS